MDYSITKDKKSKISSKSGWYIVLGELKIPENSAFEEKVPEVFCFKNLWFFGVLSFPSAQKSLSKHVSG